MNWLDQSRGPPIPIIKKHMDSTRRVSSDVVLGREVVIVGFCNLYGCEIGDGTKVGAFVEIQRGAKIGARCKISSHTFICDGVTIEDGVFVGHHVTFTNDRNPQALNDQGALKTDTDWKCGKTIVRSGASIGSGSTVLSGIVIGEGALVGAGSVVTKDIPPGMIVAGNPARPITHKNDADDHRTIP
jgi:UDP-2-acetamido-3-amino-2,3-dideoxy-glucuronate N-acetyltransferase